MGVGLDEVSLKVVQSGDGNDDGAELGEGEWSLSSILSIERVTDRIGIEP